MAVLLENKKAHFNYEVLEILDAGIELFGHEVKSLRKGRAKLEGSHIIVRGGEAYIVGMKIDPYQPSNVSVAYDPERTKKLLLTKKELVMLGDKETAKGLTIVPLKLYDKGSKLKLSIAIVRGKKLFDKRESIKKRDVDRELRRVMKAR